VPIGSQPTLPQSQFEDERELLSFGAPSGGRDGTIGAGMADTTAAPLHEQLEEIGAQLAWVRDYL
jgi:hypothetical protein